MSVEFTSPVKTAPSPAWLRYRGRVAVIEATGLVDTQAEGPLRDLAGSAVLRGCVTVVLDIRRATLDDCSIPVLARLDTLLDDVGVGFAVAGPSREARVVLQGAGDRLDLPLYSSMPAPPPWSGAISGGGLRAAW